MASLPSSPSEPLSSGGLLTAKEASAFLHVPTTTLAVWRSTNRVYLPFVKLGAHLVRYRPEDLNAFVTTSACIKAAKGPRPAARSRVVHGLSEGQLLVYSESQPCPECERESKVFQIRGRRMVCQRCYSMVEPHIVEDYAEAGS